MMARFLLYLLRWQLSGIVLYPTLLVMADFNTFTATVVANLVGGCLFFLPDKYIFTKNKD